MTLQYQLHRKQFSVTGPGEKKTLKADSRALHCKTLYGVNDIAVS